MSYGCPMGGDSVLAVVDARNSILRFQTCPPTFERSQIKPANQILKKGPEKRPLFKVVSKCVRDCAQNTINIAIFGYFLELRDAPKRAHLSPKRPFRA